jgi:GNAT superfamily N-acetyltransferase
VFFYAPRVVSIGAGSALLTSPMQPSQPALRLKVQVTFLRMDAPPTSLAPSLPADARVERVRHCSVPFYRYLYDTVGATWLWWMRRIATDAELAGLLGHPSVSVHVLMRDGEPAGFYELDHRSGQTANLSYFGLMPWAIGTGLGAAFLRHAVDAAWQIGLPAVTVNTCNADHPRALPGYLAAGFRRLRAIEEVWPVPLSLGMVIPPHLPRLP